MKGTITSENASASLHHKNLKDGILGLKNNSLYCYMNATLQCLLAIEPMRDYFITASHGRFQDAQTVSGSNLYCRHMSDFFLEAHKCDAK